MASDKKEKDSPEEKKPDDIKLPIQDKKKSQKIEEPPQTEQDRLI